MKFALLMLVVHFPVYWLPPGGRQRYIIMLYPFIIQVLVYFYLMYFEREKEKSRVLNIIITSAIGIATLACLAPLLAGKPENMRILIPVSLVTFVIMAALFVFLLKKPRYAVLSLLFSLLALRFLFGFAVLPVRATEGRAPENKAAAIKISEMTRGQMVSILKPTYFPMQSVFYFEKDRNEILPASNSVEPGQYYIVEKIILENYRVYREEMLNGRMLPHPFSDPFSEIDQAVIPGNSFKTILEFKLQKRDYLLIAPLN
jgi:hypothetical protein